MGRVIAVAAAAFVAASPAKAATVAVVGKMGHRALVRVEPRTLEPLRGAARIRLHGEEKYALSPDSTRVAIDLAGAIAILDTRTGRILYRYRNEGFDYSEGLYWVGSSAEPLVIAVGQSRFGYEYTAVPPANGSADTDVAPVAALDGYVVGTNGHDIGFFGLDEPWATLAEAPPGGYSVASDIAHGRVYVVYNAGVVAELSRTSVKYHRVSLSGYDFFIVWAGHHQLALWGSDGLGVIDTRTWKARALTRYATGAIGTRYGIVTWNSTTNTGVAVYAPNGRRRLHVLRKMEVDPGLDTVIALGRYAYARVWDGTRQYSIDLKTGNIRRIRTDAHLVVPTLVSVP